MPSHTTEIDHKTSSGRLVDVVKKAKWPGSASKKTDSVVKRAGSVVKKAGFVAKKAGSAAKKAVQKISFSKLPKVSTYRPGTTRLKLTESDLINAESAIGGTIFGPIPAGHRREFFRFKDNVWVYHENWTKDGKPLESTITYEVKKDGVFKSPLGGQYVKISGAELLNFYAAVRAYYKLIRKELY